MTAVTLVLILLFVRLRGITYQHPWINSFLFDHIDGSYRLCRHVACVLFSIPVDYIIGVFKSELSSYRQSGHDILTRDFNRHMKLRY